MSSVLDHDIPLAWSPRPEYPQITIFDPKPPSDAFRQKKDRIHFRERVRIWKDLIDQYDEYFPDRSTFEWYLRLGNPDAGTADWIDAILQIAGNA